MEYLACSERLRRAGLSAAAETCNLLLLTDDLMISHSLLSPMSVCCGTVRFISSAYKNSLFTPGSS